MTITTWNPLQDLDAPLHWRKPRVVRVGDLFRTGVLVDELNTAFAVMALCPQHTFQLPTNFGDTMAQYMCHPDRKRMIASTVMSISNMLAAKAGTHEARIKLDDFSAAFKGSGPFPNLHLGVIVTNKSHLPRVEHLLRTPAAVRFVACEGLTEEVVLPWNCCPTNPGDPSSCTIPGSCLCELLHWLTVSGETGKDARPLHPAWVRSLRDQCHAAGVAFSFLGWGEFAPLEKHHVMVTTGNYCFTPSGEKIFPDKESREIHVWPATETHSEDCFSAIRVGAKASGRTLDGVVWDEMVTKEPQL